MAQRVEITVKDSFSIFSIFGEKDLFKMIRIMIKKSLNKIHRLFFDSFICHIFEKFYKTHYKMYLFN